MEIKLLDNEKYKGEKYRFEYLTPGYYDLIVKDMTFNFVYKEFEEVQMKAFEDELLSDWLEAPVLYGAYLNDKLAGIIEGSIEEWNNRFRISNILVFEGYRNKQIGTKLIQYMDNVAKTMGARMIVLETQSCNVPAIHCYMKNGFHIIGFDTHAYSNCDIEKCEVRIEMGMEL